MSWNDLLGQAVAARFLQRAVAAGRVAHAYLFVGPEGTGRRLAARTLAKAMGCESPPAPGDSCDWCRHCRRVDGQTHENVLTVEPRGREIRLWQVVRREESDRQGVVPVLEFLSVRPDVGRRKLVILDGAEALNPEAANSLLKSLEEPPPYGHFVLLAANPAAVLPTIRSRCQVVPFSPLPSPVIEERLVREGIPPEAARIAAGLSGGSLGRALQLAGDPGLLDRRREVLDWLVQVPDRDDAWRLALAGALDQQRERVIPTLDVMAACLREALVAAEGGPVAPGPDADGVRRLAGWGRDRLVRAVEAVHAARGWLDRNANPRLVLDVLFLRLST